MQNTTTFGAHVRRRAVAHRTGAETAYWALRIGSAMCFIGHGAFGFITKAAWLPYFGVVGIPESVAWKLMPLIGAVDVTAGMAVLFAPRALPLIYMSVWALWTALLRPFSGESVFEAVERAGNYGVPLAMLLMTALPLSLRSVWQRLDGPIVKPHVLALVTRVLKWTTALLLFGHGALGALTHKATTRRPLRHDRTAGEHGAIRRMVRDGARDRCRGSSRGRIAPLHRGVEDRH